MEMAAALCLTIPSLCFKRRNLFSNEEIIKITAEEIDDLFELKDEKFKSFLINLLYEHKFEFYLSNHPRNTYKLILSGKRPDIWHFIYCEDEFSDREIYIKISSLEPKRFTFLNYKNFDFPSDMKFDEAVNEELLNKRIILYLCKFNEISSLTSSHARTPLKIDEWITGVLDSCYLHVNGDKKFPTLMDGHREEDYKVLRNWSFTAMNRKCDELLRLTFRVFEDFELLKVFEISEDRFKSFLLAVNCNYFDNPYHNFCHVVDVLQCCYYLLKNALDGRIPDLLGSNHLFALLIGCLCHDLGHPSFGNSFIKNSSHPLSILFNDSSVLENYHSMILFSILRCPLYNWSSSCNENFSNNEFRKCVLGCILGTDMSNHFDFIKQFNEQFPKIKDDSIQYLNETQKVQLATALIKCSDISNVLRPFPIAKSWGIALLREFFLQGDYEKLLEIPLGPLNDRACLKTGPAQYQFLTVVAAPLYRVVANKIDGLEFFDLWIKENSENWLNYTEDREDERLT